MSRNTQAASSTVQEYFETLRVLIDHAEGSELHYRRSRPDLEVDFILNDSTAVEVKSKVTIGNRELKGLRALKEEELLNRCILVYPGRDRRITDDSLEIMPCPLSSRHSTRESSQDSPPGPGEGSRT